MQVVVQAHKAVILFLVQSHLMVAVQVEYQATVATVVQVVVLTQLQPQELVELQPRARETMAVAQQVLETTTVVVVAVLAL